MTQARFGDMRVSLRLFVSGADASSAPYLSLVRQFCQLWLPGQHKLEIVDVAREPQRAEKERILVTPTLVLVSPTPSRRIVGVVDRAQDLAVLLGIDVSAQLNLTATRWPNGRDRAAGE